MNAKSVIIFLVLVLVVIAGFFAFNYFKNSNKYSLTSSNEMNPSDFLFPGGITQVQETYTDGQISYAVRVMQFSDEASAVDGITKLTDLYNPAMIGLATKYVKYKELSPGSQSYFYKSGKYIIYITLSGDKGLGDSFVMWYYSKYPNK